MVMIMEMWSKVCSLISFGPGFLFFAVELRILTASKKLFCLN